MTDTLTRTPATVEGPIPPQALEAERSVLAAMMLDFESIGRALELLDPTAFYRVAHQKMFEAVVALYNRNEKADLVTVAEELRKRGDLEAIGGQSALAQVLEYATTSANLEEHARIVNSKWLLRSLIRSASEIQQECFADADESGSILDRAEQRIFAITDRRVRQGLVPLKELLKPAFEQIQSLYERKTLVTGVPSGYEDLDKMTSGFQPGDLVIIAGRPSMGKCLTAESLVDDPRSGERLTIEECVRRRLQTVMGVSADGEVREATIEGWIDSGTQPCYRVSTRLGRQVAVTGHHPFLTTRGWLPLNEMSTGMQIAVPRALPTFGTDESWSPAAVRLLAYFIAEGGLTNTCPHFTNTDPAIVTDFHAALAAEFPECETNLTGGITYRVARRKELRRRLPNGQLPENPTKAWLEKLGLMGKLSAEKSFPACVWRWPERLLGEFMRTLFSCDATIYSLRGAPRIEFTVASRRLAEDVQHALARFGIVAKLWQKTEKSWRVEITDSQSVGDYQQQIGWVGEKESRFAGHHFDPPKRGSNRGHPGPDAWAHVALAADLQEMEMVELFRRAGEPVKRGFNPHRRRGIPRARLEAFAHCLQDSHLMRMASPSLYWDEIVSIESIGERQVYDLSVPDGANFIANDVVVHNTSLAVNVAENAAIHHKIPVAVFSLEMSKEQLVLRMLGSQSEVPLHKIRNGFLGQEDWPRLTTGAGLLTQAPIMIDDSASLTVFEIRAKCRRLKAEGKLGLLVIDYLQLIRGSGRSENRVQEVSQITRGLKSLAKELDVPIIALSQLSRAPEQRGTDRRPQLSDLRESGSVEQDSDVVIFVFREEYYKPDDPTLKGKATLIVSKQRNGPTGDITLTFLRECTKFLPYSPISMEEGEPAF